MKISQRYFTIFFKSLTVLMMVLLTISSCKKENDRPDIPASNNEALQGTYLGKYGFDGDEPDTDQKYLIKAGGIFQELGMHSGMVVGQGTWKLAGNQFTAAYTVTFEPFTKYSVRATFNASAGTLTGTWGGENDPTDGGKIDMKKQ